MPPGGTKPAYKFDLRGKTVRYTEGKVHTIL